jgi:selenocysteine-specific elongation factor
MIIGTAGHIDHGKTSLVRSLTGIDTDRLKEERARGISIELGYAYTPLVGGDVLGYVDVPGHERLIHTMVAGAGGIDFALLVIAADDGVMPQTREHLAIIELLGVTQGVIALTKIDRVAESRVRTVGEQIAALLSGGPLAGAPQFPLVATDADDPGVVALRAHLHAAAATSRTRYPEDRLFRLAIDRVFTLPGRGTVVAGMVRAGRVEVDDWLSVMPRAMPVRVRSIHAQNRETSVGRAGQRCALLLAGIEKSEVARGDWLAHPQALIATKRIDVRLRLLAAGEGIANRATVHVHLGTAHRVARAAMLEGDDLAPGASARVQLVFDGPLCAAPGDFLILRDAQAAHTLGGGTVLDSHAPARRRRSPQRLAYLATIERLLSGEGLEPLLREAPEGIALQQLAGLCGCEPERVSLPGGARIVDAGAGSPLVILDTHWQALGERAAAAVRAFHAEQPHESGIDRGRLRRMTAPAMPDGLWRALIEELLVRKVLEQTHYALHLPGHRISLSPAEQGLAEILCRAIAAGGFDPPWVRELALRTQTGEDEVRRVLRSCAIQGQVLQVVRDLFYDRDRIRELAVILRRLVTEHRLVETARYRDAIRVGRKRAIQILEFFDRVGYTRRILDARILRTDSAWQEGTEQ